MKQRDSLNIFRPMSPGTRMLGGLAGGGVDWASYYRDKHPEINVYTSGRSPAISDKVIVIIGRFIDTIKTGLGINSLGDAFDLIYLKDSPNADACLRNLVKRSPDFDATPVNKPIHIPYYGIKYDGTETRILTKWNGRTAGHAVAYSLNSASFGLYFETTTDKATLKRSGTFSKTADGGIANALMIEKPHGFANYYKLGINSGVEFQEIDERLTGMLIGTRTASDVQKLYMNKVVKTSGTATSTKIPNQQLIISGVVSPDVSYNYFENDVLSFAFLGKGFNATEVGIITDAYTTYRASMRALETVLQPNFVITTDGSYNSLYTSLFPLLVSKGVKATFYVQSDPVGVDDRVTWAQFVEMSNAGMDIQCHGKTHDDYRTLSDAQIVADLQGAETAFLANGLNAPMHHAYHGGYYNSSVITSVAKERLTASKINSIAKFIPFHTTPKFVIDRMGIQNNDITNAGGSVAAMAAIKAKMDICASESRTLVVYFHGISDSDIEMTPAAFLTELIDYAKSKNINIPTISELYDNVLLTQTELV